MRNKLVLCALACFGLGVGLLAEPVEAKLLRPMYGLLRWLYYIEWAKVWSFVTHPGTVFFESILISWLASLCDYYWGFSRILRDQTSFASSLAQPAKVVASTQALPTLGAYATSLSYRLSERPLDAFSAEVKAEAWRTLESYRVITATGVSLSQLKTDAESGVSSIRVRELRDVSHGKLILRVGVNSVLIENVVPTLQPLGYARGFVFIRDPAYDEVNVGSNPLPDGRVVINALSYVLVVCTGTNVPLSSPWNFMKIWWTNLRALIPFGQITPLDPKIYGTNGGAHAGFVEFNK